jgi:hypothetical protein
MLDHLLQNKTKITTKSSKLAILQRFFCSIFNSSPLFNCNMASKRGFLTISEVVSAQGKENQPNNDSSSNECTSSGI